ncbi:AI-2E family transporter [Flavobacterium sp. GT3R68]|uniref:AI-2E family transporter n=1 Tax=Flavobacterium sp. GT3R68 TaxID=2594437 RepID=UPI000F86474B|nr:AI-2E family transporter [Flavobacterium sp. GT3R68]RTY95035.1 AI-2E family transporter [Flavobacterium sp. GSN2]TRW91841.1 AI-2E family transporter [Flavobacterium sp. GT3R68]
MNDTVRLPFYAKLALTLLSLVAIFTILYFGQNIIIPLLLALLFAILLRPVSHFLKSKLRFPHVIAVMFSVFLFVIVVAGIITFISWQISGIANDWNTIKNNLSLHIDNLQEIVRDNFNLSKREQKKLLNEATESSLNTGKDILGSTLMSFTATLLNLLIIPIYTFLILLYRTHFIKFLCQLFKPEYHNTLNDILCQVKVSVQSYITGLMIQMVTVSTLTAVGFMIIGVKYAIVLGLITGILNLIPYIGILFAGFLSVIATLTGSPDLSMILSVVIVIVIVQLIDNNLIVTMIVSSKVKINALASIVGIVIGGAMCGVPGMFLAIPILAILKVIFDRIESLKPWGYLISDDLPKTYTWRNITLPLFDSETAKEITQTITESKPPVFTKTTTGEPLTNDDCAENETGKGNDNKP